MPMLQAKLHLGYAFTVAYHMNQMLYEWPTAYRRDDYQLCHDELA
jgi:hypothetical protein